ncbi:MAG: hypothetical protein ABIA37_00530 [Candidatus Woesearchaeota archaeon]
MAKKKKTTRKRTARKAHPKEEKTYFIGIDDPAELRKLILEPTREVVQFLQSYEQFKKTKEEKTQSIKQLKEDLSQIKSEMAKLKRLLPAIKIEKPARKEKIREEVVQEVTVRTKPAPKPSGELEELEKELSEIEQRLGTLPE